MDIRAAICEVEPYEGEFILRGHILNVTDTSEGQEFGIKIDPAPYATMAEFQAAALQAVVDAALRDYGETLTVDQVVMPQLIRG